MQTLNRRPPARTQGRHGQPRLPQGAGRFRAHPHPAARRGLCASRPTTPAPTWSSSTPAASSTRAKEESLEAIGEAMAENGRVIVTGCLGVEARAHPRRRIPSVLAVTGPHQYEEVVDAVHAAVPPAHDPLRRPGAAAGHPPDAAPLHLSEDFRGLQPPLLASASSRSCAAIWSAARSAHVLREAERLVAAGRARSCWSSARTPAPTASTSATRRAVWKGRPVTRAHAPTLPASWASSAPGCGCTTSTPTRTSTR